MYIEQNKMRHNTIDYTVCSGSLGKGIVQAFVTRASVEHEFVRYSGSKFSDAPPLPIDNQGPVNLLINGLIVSSVGLYPC